MTFSEEKQLSEPEVGATRYPPSSSFMKRQSGMSSWARPKWSERSLAERAVLVSEPYSERGSGDPPSSFVELEILFPVLGFSPKESRGSYTIRYSKASLIYKGTGAEKSIRFGRRPFSALASGETEKVYYFNAIRPRRDGNEKTKSRKESPDGVSRGPVLPGGARARGGTARVRADPETRSRRRESPGRLRLQRFAL